MAFGLVLSGGGAKGAFEAGVYAAIEEAGIQPTVLSGTSAGALNAAAIAAGFDAARLAEWWCSVTDRDVYRLRRDVWRLFRPAGLFGGGSPADRLLSSIGWTWLWDARPLRETLTRALDGESVDVRPGITLALSAVDISTGRLVRFTNRLPPQLGRRGKYRQVDLTVDHLLASAAIPLLFQPADVGGMYHWDGGLVANTPVAPALAYEARQILVVTTATLERPAPPPRNLAEAAGQAVDTVQRFSLDSDLAHAETINQLKRADPEATDKGVVELFLIDPRGLDLGQSLRFDPRQARRLIDVGYEVGAKSIAEWRASGRLR